MTTLPWSRAAIAASTLILGITSWAAWSPPKGDPKTVAWPDDLNAPPDMTVRRIKETPDSVCFHAHCGPAHFVYSVTATPRDFSHEQAVKVARKKFDFDVVDSTRRTTVLKRGSSSAGLWSFSVKSYKTVAALRSGSDKVEMFYRVELGAALTDDISDWRELCLEAHALAQAGAG